VFFSSHLVGEVEQLAQRVGIVQAGRTRFEGDVVELRASVRRIITEPAFVPADGFERLRADVFRASVPLWDSTAWPAGTEIRQLSLEDIFLAFTRTDRAAAG
jgi:ABC-type multidrug transport system ATPase subunit